MIEGSFAELVDNTRIGGLMLLVTAASWFVVQVSKNGFVVGVPALGFLIGLGIASWAVIDPLEHCGS